MKLNSLVSAVVWSHIDLQIKFQIQVNNFIGFCKRKKMLASYIFLIVITTWFQQMRILSNLELLVQRTSPHQHCSWLLERLKRHPRSLGEKQISHISDSLWNFRHNMISTWKNFDLRWKTNFFLCVELPITFWIIA